MSDEQARPSNRLQAVSVEQQGPSDEEIAAAVIALIASRSVARAPAEQRPSRSAWASTGHRLGTAYGVLPGGWRRSGLPR